MPKDSTSGDASLAPGLYIVGTPIGNLQDITLRALKVLREVDVIACEDTRQTQKLLGHYNISVRTVSYHEHNEVTRSAELVLELEQGARVALVTDAGMPGISDPGFRLISLAVRHHVPVVPIPGAAAFLTALSASGLASDAFRFGGFLPARQGQRRAALEGIRDSSQTEIFYEAPRRIGETLEDIVAILGEERHVVVARELTKMHEEFLRGRAAEVLEKVKARGETKGEITLLIGKLKGSARSAVERVNIQERMNRIMSAEGVDEKAALKKLARELGISKSEAYRQLQRSKV